MINFGEFLIYTASFFSILTTIYFFITMLENRTRLSNPEPKNGYYSTTIIVPAYNEEKTIGKTIQSILDLNYPKNKLKVIVVDDGSTDNTYKIAKRYESRQVTVLKKKNGGKATAMNLALKRCKTELVGGLDADSFVSPDALKRIIGFFNDKRVMAVTPSMKIYKANTTLEKIQKIEYLVGIFLRKIFALLGSIHVTPGPFTIYRREFFTKYGGYDENNMTEDIEIALRIQSHDYIIENSVNALVYTVPPKNWNVLYNQRIRWYMGFTKNVFNYKHLFGKKHGNLGIVILPASFAITTIIISLLLYTIYKITDDSIKRLINLNSIDFDIWAILKPNIDIFYLNIGTITFIGVIAMTASLIIIMTAKILSEEKSSIKTPYLFFIILYWPLYAYWWTMSWINIIRGKDIGWGHKSIRKKKTTKILKD